MCRHIAHIVPSADIFKISAYLLVGFPTWELVFLSISFGRFFNVGISMSKCGHLIFKICADIYRQSHKCTDILKEYGHILRYRRYPQLIPPSNVIAFPFHQGGIPSLSLPQLPQFSSLSKRNPPMSTYPHHYPMSSSLPVPPLSLSFLCLHCCPITSPAHLCCCRPSPNLQTHVLLQPNSTASMPPFPAASDRLLSTPVHFVVAVL